MISPLEVRRGLVVRFDPAELLANGAAPDRPRESAVLGPHYFVCIGRTGPWSVWVPAFSRWIPGRVKLIRKWGHPAWAHPESWLDLLQMWTVPDDALSRASRVDPSRPGERNHAACDFLLGSYELAQSA